MIRHGDFNGVLDEIEACQQALKVFKESSELDSELEQQRELEKKTLETIEVTPRMDAIKLNKENLELMRKCNQFEQSLARAKDECRHEIEARTNLEKTLEHEMSTSAATITALENKLRLLLMSRESTRMGKTPRAQLIGDKENQYLRAQYSNSEVSSSSETTVKGGKFTALPRRFSFGGMIRSSSTSRERPQPSPEEEDIYPEKIFHCHSLWKR